METGLSDAARGRGESVRETAKAEFVHPNKFPMQSPTTLHDEHPIDPAIRAQIEHKLAEMERDHNVRVLFACESGSRGWGFASPDSDYDVRFVYAHPVEWYLRVMPGRDVIEQPVNAVFDVSGWDLRKALALLKKGNATLMEWLDSPVVYQANAVFLARMREVALQVHRPERSFHHYVNMARKNFREHMKVERVRLKKYLYVLRPLLAAVWVERKRTVAPMRFQELVDGMVTDTLLRQAIAELLIIKRQVRESEYGAAIPAINSFIVDELARLESISVPHRDHIDFSPLDELLRDTVLSRG